MKLVTVSSLSSCIRTVATSDFRFMKMETHLNINKAEPLKFLKARVKCVALLLQPSCIALYGLEILSFSSLVSANKKNKTARERGSVPGRTVKCFCAPRFNFTLICAVTDKWCRATFLSAMGSIHQRNLRYLAMGKIQNILYGIAVA